MIFQRKKYLSSLCHLAEGKKKEEGKKKLLCAVNIEQQPSPDDPCCIQFLPKCFLLNLHQTDTRHTKENLITKGN